MTPAKRPAIRNKTRRVLIGIDLGTTVLKMAAFDKRSGRVLAQTARRLPVDVADDGKREQRLEDIIQALMHAAHALRRDLGHDWKSVLGLGLASQGGSAIIVDRVTGAPHTPMMLWNDARPMPLLTEIGARKPRRFWRQLTLLDAPGAGLARLRWYQQRRPVLFHPGNLYVGAGEFLYFRLTGVWRQDAGNALQIGCYDTVNQRLDRRPLDLVNVPLSFVAPLRQGHEIHSLSEAGAQLLGLPTGIPVAGPYIDQEAGYLSAACRSARCPLQCSLGTAWVGNFVLPESATGASPFQLRIPSPAGPGQLVIQPLLTGNVTWDWGLTTLAHTNLKTALKHATALFRDALLPPSGLIALPWFTQPNPLTAGLLGGGAFFGMNPHTTSDDLLRALALGMVCELGRVFAAVKESGIIDVVTIGGGAGRGEFFRKLLAAVFAPLPVLWQHEDLAAARGALHAFGGAATIARMTRVAAPTKALQKSVAVAGSQYQELFSKLYASCVMGGAFELQSIGRHP